jgi:hypothetical protein
MRHFVIGAGATLAEAKALEVPKALWPPIISNFARKTWADYSPWPLLDLHLKEIGRWRDVPDSRELFYELEAAGVTNIERFMEFAWHNRHLRFEPPDKLVPGYISGFGVSVGGYPHASQPPRQFEFWENLLHHGVGRPIMDAVVACFFENGVGFKNLALAQRIARRVKPEDLVINLNYDTVFEIALTQLGRRVTYVPAHNASADALVCKPHGSLNMTASETRFGFGPPDSIGALPPPGFAQFSGLIPPRLNKHYAEHPIAKLMFDAVRGRSAHCLTMWGVGLTESDADLIELYSGWTKSAHLVEIINPDPTIAHRARKLFDCEVAQYEGVDAWEVHQP